MTLDELRAEGMRVTGIVRGGGYPSSVGVDAHWIAIVEPIPLGEIGDTERLQFVLDNWWISRTLPAGNHERIGRAAIDDAIRRDRPE